MTASRSLDLKGAQVVVYAPHAEEPAHDGGSIRSWKFYEALNQRVDCVFISREHAVLGDRRQRIVPPVGGKRAAALRTVLALSHYVKERHVSKASIQTFREAAFYTGCVYANFVWSSDLLNGRCPDYIDTHNSEARWFDNIAGTTRSPLVKLVCAISKRHSIESLRQLSPRVVLVHVSEEDRRWYAALCPQSRHVVVPNGCTIVQRALMPSFGGKRQLYFLGNLGLSMNEDALQHLGESGWQQLSTFCDLRVLGARPSERVRRLCARFGWKLFADLPSDELDRVVADCEFAIMPFERSAGTKLKFYDALGRGMYVLATPAAICGISAPPRSVAIAHVRDWADVVRHTSRLGREAVIQAQKYASEYSWDSVYSRFFDTDPGPLGVVWRECLGP